MRVSVLWMTTLLVAGTPVAVALAAGSPGVWPLAERIEEQARQDERLVGTRVAVAAERGDVVLSGTVRLYGQKLRYEQIAWQTAGVRDVENEIRVVPLMPVDDAEIERQVVGILHPSRRFHGAGIRVEVSGGFVRLAGTFHDPADVLFLKHLVADVEGVVDMEITVRFQA